MVLTAPHNLTRASTTSTMFRASNLCGTVRFSPINFMALGTLDAPRAEVIGMHFKAGRCKRQFKFSACEAGILHRGGSRMLDGMAIDRANARDSIDCRTIRHREVIGQEEPKFKLQNWVNMGAGKSRPCVLI